MALWSGQQGVFLPGSGTAKPPGLESIVDYNGITINDRRVMDKYRVRKFSGLHGGSEIRSSEENNSSSIGATPLTNLPGGKTFIIEGTIQAGNTDKLRDMQQALTTAFFSMVERPMVFHSPLTGDCYIMCRPTDQVSMTDEHTKNDRLVCDFQISMRATDPRIYSSTLNTLTIPLGIYDTFNSSTPFSARLAKRSGNGTATYTSGDVVLAQGSTGVFLQRVDMGFEFEDSQHTIKFNTGTVNANYSVYLWSKYDNSAPTEYLSARVQVNGASSLLYMYSNSANVSLNAQQGSTSAAFTLSANTDYWFRFKNAGNVLTTYIYSSDPSVGSPSPIQSITTTLTLAVSDAFGAGASGTLGIQALWTSGTTSITIKEERIEPISIVEQSFTITPGGNYLSMPQVVMTSPIGNVILNNQTLMPDETFNRYARFDFIYAGGSTITYDARDSTVVDNAGANQERHIVVGSRQFQLAPGVPNSILISADSMSTVVPQIVINYRDTWI